MADDEQSAEGEVPADATPSYSAAPLTGWQRLTQTFLNPPGPRSGRPQVPAEDLSNLSDDERRRRINQIDATERKIGLAAGALSAVFALVYSIPRMVSKTFAKAPTKPKHGACSNQLTYTVHHGAAATCNYASSELAFHLVVGLILSAAIFVTVFVGRRALMAFTIVIAGLFAGNLVLGVPFIAAGGWLLLRAWRTQRYGSPTARSPVEGYVAAPARGARRPPASASRSATRRKRGDQAESDPAARKPPVANKRYTPKTAKKKPPPPPE